MIDKLKKLFGTDSGRPAKNLSRNDLCWCGSGEKYKRCHLEKDLEKDRRKAAACKSYS